MAPEKADRLYFVQGLRGIAAIAVVVTHLLARAAWEGAQHGGQSSAAPIAGAAGVDLFFVISGFIMVYSSAGLFGKEDASAVFLRRRLIRIVPLYWACTFAFFLLTWVTATRPSVAGLLTSLSFLPVDAAGAGSPPVPLLPPGWTLNYEMMFYALFSCFVWLPRARAATLVMATLAALVAVGQFCRPASHALAFWTAPIILEFAAGVAIAWARPRLSGRMALLLVAVAAAWELLLPLPPIAFGRPEIGFHRLLLWGVPAALLVTATYNAPLTRYTARIADFLGEISYALYVVHVPVILVLTPLWFGAAHLRSDGGFVATGLLLSLAVAWVAYRFYDAPVRRILSSRVASMRRFRPQSGRSVPDPAAGAITAVGKP